MQTIRLKFSKIFDSRYISHLDLVRVFTRAITRAKLEAWFTEGFNTHLYLMFPLPLSLGFESICETLDIKVEDDCDIAYFPERINRYLPFGIEVYDCRKAIMKPTEIAFARYFIDVYDQELSLDSMQKAFEQVYGLEKIVVTKKSKAKKFVEVDIKPQIQDLSFKQHGERLLIDLTCEAGTQKNLNPMLLLNKVFEILGKQPDFYLVKRTKVLTQQFKNFE